MSWGEENAENAAEEHGERDEKHREVPDVACQPEVLHADDDSPSRSESKGSHEEAPGEEEPPEKHFRAVRQKVHGEGEISFMPLAWTQAWGRV